MGSQRGNKGIGVDGEILEKIGKYVINTSKSQEKVCKIRENTCVRLQRVWGGTGKQIITILETCKIYE